MDRPFFVDIETLPAGELIKPETLECPGNISKPETIAKWYAEKAPLLAKEQYLRMALDSMAGKIFCVGWHCDGQGGVISAEDEFHTIYEFEALVKQIMDRYRISVPFVGWNARAFDMAWLWRKAVQYRCVYLRDAIRRDRHRGNVIDLMEVWQADFKDYRKMKDVAAFLGIEDRSGGIDGSQVYDLYQAGEYEKIREYCMGDVLTVRDIYRMIYQ
jgi:hypothetical protein